MAQSGSTDVAWVASVSRHGLALFLLTLIALGFGLEQAALDYVGQARLQPVGDPVPAGFRALMTGPGKPHVVHPGGPPEPGSFLVPEDRSGLEDSLSVTLRIIDKQAGGTEQTVWLETIESGVVGYSVYLATATGYVPLRYADIPPLAWRWSVVAGLRRALGIWLTGAVLWFAGSGLSRRLGH